MQIDLNQYSATQFSNYLSDVTAIGNHDIENLENLLSQYPYCQILHTLLARAAIGTPKFDERLEKAAIYATSREALYAFITSSNESRVLGDELFSDEQPASGFEQSAEQQWASGFEQSAIGQKPISLNDDKEAETENIFEEVTEENPLAFADENQKVEEPTGDEPRASGFEQSAIGQKPISLNDDKEAETENIFEEITEENPLAFADENQKVEEATGDEPRASGFEQAAIDQKSISLNDDKEAQNPQPEAEVENLVVTEAQSLQPEAEVENPVVTEAQSPLPEAEVENPVVTEAQSPLPEADNPKPVAIFPQIETYDHHDSVLIKEIEEEAISAINNLSFTTPESPKPEAQSPRQEETESPKPEAQDPHQEETRSSQPVAHLPQHQNEPIALYNDEKLPFTFLWWLNKTRIEHYENNQPYLNLQPIARSHIPEAGNHLLNHQIAENILHHGALDKYKDDTQTLEPITKEDKIIKKFIREEPQIKPLPADKIDTENKAKASSADGGELVSETLAKIYVEQMLYAKALETYKKLSLKYPEKSTYFASQIKYLELKVN